jgi:hypothetical protein
VNYVCEMRVNDSYAVVFLWAIILTQNDRSNAGLILSSITGLHNFNFHFYISCRENLPMDNNYFIQNVIIWNFGIILPECLPTVLK